MATTAAVKHRLDVVQIICCQMVDRDMTEEQMRPEFERVLQGQDLYGNTVMHYFALRVNDVADQGAAAGWRVHVHSQSGQSAIDVRRTQELRMLDAQLPMAVVVFKPSAEPDMRIELIGDSPPSAQCVECEA